MIEQMNRKKKFTPMTEQEILSSKERDREFVKLERKLEQKEQRKREEVFPDGSCIEGRAAFGVYKRKGSNRKVAYRVIGNQNAYNEELQGAIYGVVSAEPNTIKDIKIKKCQHHYDRLRSRFLMIYHLWKIDFVCPRYEKKMLR